MSVREIYYRESMDHDINDMAKIRSVEWGTKEYWQQRIAAYLNKELHPQHALLSRACYVALEHDTVIGFIAGHLSKRYNCDGELQWINVMKEQRGTGVGLELIRLLAKWFIENKAQKICVDPGDDAARRFYLKHGAEELNKHWLYWRNIDVFLNNKG